jgi:hypothetical protein
VNYLIIGEPKGHHTINLIEQGVNPADIYVWEDSAKGQYCVTMEGATVTDNLDDFDGMKFDVVIGNPPYGSGGNLAIRFLNKCGDLSDDIRLVMPVSIRKPSSQNKVRLDLVCVEDNDLPQETFGKNITAVSQRWVKTDTLREKIVTFTTHPDFEFVKKSETPDCMIFRCGASSGKVVFEFEDNKPDHYYIRATSDIVKRLQSISEELISISRNVNGMPGISKHDLITTYMTHYE